MQKEIIKWMTSLETIEDHLSNSTNQNCLRSIFSIHHQRKHHSKVAACLQATIISLEGIAEKKLDQALASRLGYLYQYHTLPSFLLLRKLQFAKISFTQECFLKNRALSSANFGQGAKKQFFKKYTMYSEYKYIAGSKIQKESSYRRVSKYFT